MEFSAVPASPHVLLIKVRNWAVSHRVFLLYHLFGYGGGILCVFQRADRLSVPFLFPPCILLWEKPPVGGETRKGFSVPNVFDSEMWALSMALPVCLSCLINLSFLAKETLIRGHYVLCWSLAVNDYKGAFFSSFYIKWWLLRNCYLVSY